MSRYRIVPNIQILRAYKGKKLIGSIIVRDDARYQAFLSGNMLGRPRTTPEQAAEDIDRYRQHQCLAYDLEGARDE